MRDWLRAKWVCGLLSVNIQIIDSRKPFSRRPYSKCARRHTATRPNSIDYGMLHESDQLEVHVQIVSHKIWGILGIRCCMHTVNGRKTSTKRKLVTSKSRNNNKTCTECGQFVWCELIFMSLEHFGWSKWAHGCACVCKCVYVQRLGK